METHLSLHRFGPSNSFLCSSQLQVSLGHRSHGGLPATTALHSAFPRPAFRLPGSRWECDQRGLLP